MVARDPARRFPGRTLVGNAHGVTLRAATAFPLTGAEGMNPLRPVIERGDFGAGLHLVCGVHRQ